MRTAVVVNGPINAGKTTVGRALARDIDGAIFIDGDDHDAPADAPLALHIEAALRRLAAEIAGNPAERLVIAYPLREVDHARLLAVAEAHATRLLTVTLAPPPEVTLGDRGLRTLDDRERARIREMYDEGYHRRAFSDVIVTGAPGVDEIVAIILARFGGLLRDG
ncbi:conserved hypothetical protein [uncultured Pleomorphomonas sp.]|uniref:Shikimate kinase n=1 Tax=uncultured Pleomorphomonas sp. TaxID=442121 RepID=A0A212LHS3_9HYPH|nr:shikimate kinase [uncultured Pleomorphomonas sp.]SCM77095.1 conserved hypothetical protein [uncultured Pleomorphomonas sp.]